MRVVVKLFAILRERAGVAETTLDVAEGSIVSTAVERLAADYPAIAPFLPRVAYAVNRSYAPVSTVLSDGDELALIPPVSGG